MRDPEKDTRIELQELLKSYNSVHDQRLALKRIQLLEEDPSAPICLNCKYCIVEGFRYHCTQFEDPGDGQVVGQYGDVYYKTKKTRKTYENVPMKSSDCQLYAPMSPLKPRT